MEKSLLTSLVKRDWQWDANELTRLAQDLELIEKSSKPSECKHFAHSTGVEISLYLEADESPRVEVYLAVFNEKDSLKKSETYLEKYEAKFAEYVEKFQTVKEQVLLLIGQPTFEGIWEDFDFPEDSLACQLAIWSLPNTKLELELRDDGDDVPLWLALVFSPNEAQA
jgi:hypothetical protein